MCGRYALALRPSQIRQMLQDDDMPVDDAPVDEGDGAPRQSYNFAPGYHGVVYRADVPSRGSVAGTNTTSHAQSVTTTTTTTTSADDQQSDDDHHHQHQHPTQGPQDAPTPTPPQETQPQTQTQTHYKLQSMKWGLIPSWTKRNPDYGAVLKTINCRDDSLASTGGMWASMKARKRCVVVAQGFYEWLKKGSNKVPHYAKRGDGKLMYFAGLWDCVRYDDDGDGEGAEHYTYTVITTDSNPQLRFLHDRMPVILEPGSEAMWRWLDPGRKEWGRELQAVLRPFEGELEVYPVSKEVGKVGNNSPSFVIPVASRENKGNIANFFAKGAEKKEKKAGKVEEDQGEVEVEKEQGEKEMETLKKVGRDADDGGMGGCPKRGVKREADTSSPVKGEPPAKKGMSAKAASPVKGKPQARGKISATSNTYRSPAKAKPKTEGSQKITKFFGNSA